jgi:hypothetical protein
MTPEEYKEAVRAAKAIVFRDGELSVRLLDPRRAVALRDASALLHARAMALEEAAKIAEQCSKGVAIEIEGNKFLLGVMSMNPAAAQESTATTIAATIRALASTEGE